MEIGKEFEGSSGVNCEKGRGELRASARFRQGVAEIWLGEKKQGGVGRGRWVGAGRELGRGVGGRTMGGGMLSEEFASEFAMGVCEGVNS